MTSIAPIYQLPYTEVKGVLSSLQLSEHYLLYQGYYNQAISLPTQINGIGSSANPAAIRGLQKTLQYALSGRELHQLYFEQLSTTSTNFETLVSTELQELLIKSFGSSEQFLIDMKAAAAVSRGWYKLEYDSVNKIAYHNVGDFHDEGSTSGFVPLLAIDMYDHAYFLDYQTDKKKYITAYCSHLRWDLVSNRLVLAS